MSAFADFYVEFLWSLLQNIGSFFASIGKAIYKFVVLDVGSYFKMLGEASPDFGVFGWICFVLVALVSTAFVVFLGYRIVQLLRRYIIHRSKEVKKDKLVEEIAKLRLQTEELAKENGKILSQKLSPAISALLSETAAASPYNTNEDDDRLRFPLLTEIDKKYSEISGAVYMTEDDMLELPDIVKHFVYYAASRMNLFYEEDTIRLLFAALASSKIIILEGLKGAGKTTLPYALGKFFKSEPPIYPVQPSWRNRAELLGYYDEFSKKYSETPFLCNLYESTLRQTPNIIILDEMNHAHAEYYFSEILSVYDNVDATEWKIELAPFAAPSDPANVIYGKLQIPQSVWFIGTIDDDGGNSFILSAEVYDRAVTIDLNGKSQPFEAPYTEEFNCSYSYLESLFDRARIEKAVSEENLARIRALDAYLREKCNIGIGNRVMHQIGLFVPVYVACGGTEFGGIDFMICSKVLRKFTMLNISYYQKEFAGICSFIEKKFGKGNMFYCVEYLKALQKM